MHDGKAQRSYRNPKIESVNGQPTTSRFNGVSRHKRGGKWIAMIRCGGTARYLGLHELEEDAARAYDCAARELFEPVVADPTYPLVASQLEGLEPSTFGSVDRRTFVRTSGLIAGRHQVQRR